MKADVILTTYAIVENEHRKAFASAKVSCPDCGRRFVIRLCTRDTRA